MKKFIIIALVLILQGCSTKLTKSSYSLDAGMTKQEVLEKMGVPDRRSMNGNNEALQYSEIVGFGQCGYIIVWLYESKVTAVTNRSGPSIAGCGLGSREIVWENMPEA